MDRTADQIAAWAILLLNEPGLLAREEGVYFAGYDRARDEVADELRLGDLLADAASLITPTHPRVRDALVAYRGGRAHPLRPAIPRG